MKYDEISDKRFAEIGEFLEKNEFSYRSYCPASSIVSFYFSKAFSPDVLFQVILDYIGRSPEDDKRRDEPRQMVLIGIRINRVADIIEEFNTIWTLRRGVPAPTLNAPWSTFSLQLCDSIEGKLISVDVIEQIANRLSPFATDFDNRLEDMLNHLYRCERHPLFPRSQGELLVRSAITWRFLTNSYSDEVFEEFLDREPATRVQMDFKLLPYVQWLKQRFCPDNGA